MSMTLTIGNLGSTIYSLPMRSCNKNSTYSRKVNNR